MSFLHQHCGGWVSSGRSGGRQRVDASARKAVGMSVRSGCREGSDGGRKPRSPKSRLMGPRGQRAETGAGLPRLQAAETGQPGSGPGVAGRSGVGVQGAELVGHRGQGKRWR